MLNEELIAAIQKAGYENASRIVHGERMDSRDRATVVANAVIKVLECLVSPDVLRAAALAKCAAWNLQARDQVPDPPGCISENPPSYQEAFMSDMRASVDYVMTVAFPPRPGR